MFRFPDRRGFTFVDLIVLTLLISLLLCLLLPAMGNAWQVSRRASCTNQLKQIGLALHNFHDAHQRFPGSNDVRLLEKPDSSWKKVPLHTPAGPNPHKGRPEYGTNFSWLAKISPYMEEVNIYKWLDMVTRAAWDDCRDVNPIDPETGEPSKKYDPCHAFVWRQPVPAFRCPDARTKDFCEANPKAGIEKNPYDSKGPYGPAALTNYVTLGATHSDSLMGVEKSRFGGGTRHPNGVMYPGGRLGLRDIMDGSSNTLIVCETREATLAAWYEGSTAAVFGLAGRPAFEPVKGVPGGAWGVPAEGAKTTLNYGDLAASPKEFHLAEGPQGVPWLHGPSSNHPGVVNHVLGDGSVRSVSENIGPALYMHLITRAGNEPVNEYFE